MRFSVYNIYILACLMAVGAAILSGVVLSNTFKAQRLETELTQQAIGLGQFAATQTIVQSRMQVTQTSSEAMSRQFAFMTRDFPVSAFEPDNVIGNLTPLLYALWVPPDKARNALNGWGITIMYPWGTDNVTFDRTINAYSDVRLTGYIEYTWAATNGTDDLCNAYAINWTGFASPVLGDFLYAFDVFQIMQPVWNESDYFMSAQPWSASDGNSYWYFLHMWSFEVQGVHCNIQTFDLAITWRDLMLGVLTPGAEMFIVDSYDDMLAATLQAEQDRVDACHGAYVDGAVPAACIDTPATVYPIADIRNARNALWTPEWDVLGGPLIPPTFEPLVLNNTRFLAVVGTLFSQNELRITLIWYQPWATIQGDVVGLTALICSLTVLSTAVLTVLGILGILHPLMRLGRAMRAVADSLKDSDQETDNKVTIEAHGSVFAEVDAISRDFQTIVVDFLGFTCTNARNNSFAPKDPSLPFAVLFTDIQSSTGLWGKDPVEMSRCIQLHHDLIRKLLQKYRLYEVKTVGDSFMVTTSSADDAVQFAIEAQLELFVCDWEWDGADAFYLETASTAFVKRPSNCHHTKGDPDYGDIWNGLRVRMGINFGLGDITHDEVSKGYDYYGNLVNAAARIESLAHGGQIIASEDVIRALSSPLDPAVAVVNELGRFPLRGVLDPPMVYEVAPTKLAGRVFPPPRVEVSATVCADGEDRANSFHSAGHNAPHINASSLTPRAHPLGGLDAAFQSVQRAAAGARRRLSGASTINWYSVDAQALPALAEESARGHSLVRLGAVPSHVVAHRLLSVRQVLEDYLLPLGAQQQATIYKALARGWGVPLPRTRGEFLACGLRIGKRMLEMPKAIAELQGLDAPAHSPSTSARGDEVRLMRMSPDDQHSSMEFY